MSELADGILPAPYVVSSQNDEDVRIWHALRDIESPLYVEVGAQHPTHLSPTIALNMLGWRGILVEPDPYYAALLRDIRPGDRVVEAGAGSEPGELVLSRFESTGLSSFSAEYVEIAAERGLQPSGTATVPIVTVDAILSEAGATEVHFLSVDVEGWELEVLRGVALEKWRPWVMSVEAIEPGSDRYVGQEVRSYLEGHDYIHAIFDGVNDWFLASEHADRLSSLRVGFSAIDSGMFGWKRAESIDRLVSELSAVEKALASQTRSLEHQEVALLEKEAEVDRYRLSAEAKRSLVRQVNLAQQKVTEPSTGPASDAFAVPQPRLRHVLLRASTAKRVIRVLVPERIRVRRHERMNYRRFVLDHTSPAFVQNGPRVEIDARVLGVSLPEGMLVPAPLSPSQVALATAFLAENPFDSDDELVERLDGFGDQVGEVLSDIRTRITLSRVPAEPPVSGDYVLFDARSLQQAAFRDRGIGVFARSLLEAVLEHTHASRVVMLIDPLLPSLPADDFAPFAQASSLLHFESGHFGLLVQPSPMTHDVAPIAQLLASGIPSLAIVFDFIPQEFPDVYLPTVPSRLRNATQVHALERYTALLPISKSVEASLHRLLPHTSSRTSVSWPQHLFGSMSTPRAQKTDQLVVFGANEPRKNTLAALAGIEKAMRGRSHKPKIVIFGMSSDEALARHWVGLARLSNDDVTVASHLPLDERDRILASSRVVIVPSFAEGLSLPVIEALQSGTVVVASRIDAHEELLGNGPFLARPSKPDEWARAIRHVAANPGQLLKRQRRVFGNHRAVTIDSVVREVVKGLELTGPVARATPSRARARRLSGARPSIGIATPLPPQRSGVADFSQETIAELAEIADVTTYVTSSAEVDSRWETRPIADAFDDAARHDAFVSVVGNSHFHLPMLSLLRRTGGVVLAHDSKMVELYAASHGPSAARRLIGGLPYEEHLFHQQVWANAYPNLGFAEIAGAASAIILHSPGAAARVATETGITTAFVPFVPLRHPKGGIMALDARRQAARRAIGFDEGAIHIVSVGIIDPRTKLNDLILEAGLWMRTWKEDVHLHFVGGSDRQSEIVSGMLERSREGGDDWFHVTGHVEERELDRYLSAADVIVQLRAGDIPMLSAPIADAAAYGTRALGSLLLLEDDALPAYVEAAPTFPSPLTLAEQLRDITHRPRDPQEMEAQRRAYLEARNPRSYAASFLDTVLELS
jgi:FkbM family methyltransferase